MGKVLVTGAGGFVGGFIAAELARDGWDVMGLARRPGDRKVPFPVVVHDLTEPLPRIPDVIAVIHAAAAVRRLRGLSAEEHRADSQGLVLADFLRHNVLATANVACFARENGVEKVFYTSSVSVYGDCRSSVMDEGGDIINPDSYALTKYAGELLLADETIFKSLRLRLPGVVGPGSEGHWLANLTTRLLAGERVVIYEPDFEINNFVPVRSLAEFVSKMIGRDDWESQTALLGCARGAKIRDIAERAKAALGSTSEIAVGRPVKPPFRLDVSRAVALGYQSPDPLEIVENYCAALLAAGRRPA